MAEIDVQDFDYLAGGSVQAQQDAAAAVADTSTIVATGTATQILGFNSGGTPEPKNVAGDSNGVGLAFSGNTLTATLTQNLQTSGTPTFAGLKIDSTGTTIDAVISATATLDFPSTAAQTSSDLTIALSGAVLGDAIFLGVPNASVNANSCFTAWVSASDVISVRFNNYSSGAIDPASGTFRVVLFRF